MSCSVFTFPASVEIMIGIAGSGIRWRREALEAVQQTPLEGRHA